MNGSETTSAERDAVHQPAMALVESPAPNACETSVSSPSSRPIAKITIAHEQRAAEADGADRLGPEPADHQRVDDPHRHPAELREDDRHGQREHRTELRTESAEREHGWGY